MHPRPQRHLRLGDVVADEQQHVAVVDVGVGGRLPVAAERLLQRLGGGRRAQPRVAVDVVRAQARTRHHGERVVLLEEELAGRVEAEGAGAPAARAARASGRRSPPSRRCSPSRRARRRAGSAGAAAGRVRRWPASRTGSLGPRRPWLMRLSARPRTPTISPSLTAMSIPSPLECSSDAVGTQRSTCSGSRSSRRNASTRTGQSPPRAYGARGPQGSAMRSGTSARLPSRVGPLAPSCCGQVERVERGAAGYPIRT